MRTVLYLAAMVWATFWYGGKCIVGALAGIKHVPGGWYDRANQRWGAAILRASGVTGTVEGHEHLLAGVPCIVASNHASWFDILALLAWLPVTVKFVSKKEIFRIPFLGQAMRAAGHVSLDRANPKEAFAVYATAAKQIVEQRLAVLIFPEGTRTRTGALQSFKKGPFVLAIQAGAPVVPVYIANTFGIQPKGSIRVHPRPIRIFVGPPIETRGLTVEDRDTLTERVREAIAALARPGAGSGPTDPLPGRALI